MNTIRLKVNQLVVYVHDALLKNIGEVLVLLEPILCQLQLWYRYFRLRALAQGLLLANDTIL